MSGKAKISLHDKYALVTLEGDPLAPEEIESILSKVTEQAVKSNINIIIFRKMPVKQQASTVDFFYYAESLAKSNFRKKLALVFPKEMHHDNLGFFKTASRNRGIIIKLFSTMEEAIEWIGSSDIKNT